MKIVLDTNILRQDFFLKSQKIEMLMDFVSKTASLIVFPEIVYKEIVALYKRTLLEKHTNFIKSYDDLKKYTVVPIEYEIPKLEVEKQVNEFVNNLKGTLKFKDIIPLNNVHLSCLVEKAVNRIHPFTEHRSEFRDALIWLCVLELAQLEKEKTVVFISANTKDFADGKGQLHPELLKESNEKEVTVQYFSSIDDFLRTKATKIDFITKEWLENNLKFEQLEKEIVSKIETYGIDRLGELAKNDQDNFEEILQVVQCVQTWVNDFYVYEMSDGTLRIEVTLESELEVEYATHEVRKDSWEMDYVFDHSKGDYDIEPVYKEKLLKKAESKCFCPIVEIEIHIIVENSEIKSVELVDWYI
jgi:predicted nucleic acid-binding protein